MATARDIVGRAQRLIGIVKSGDSLNESYFQDGLIALNTMIESWQADKPIAYALQDKAFTLAAGDPTITLGGTTPNIDTRPIEIDNIYVRAGGTDYPIKLVEQERWFAIPDKATSSDIPELAYYAPSYPTGVLNLWPVPSVGNVLHVVFSVPVSTLSSLSTTVAFPPGYERALAYNLAIEIAPEFQKHVSDEVAKIAAESLANIKRANHRPIISYTDLVPLTSMGSNIESDQA
jgi:hypothetical protein